MATVYLTNEPIDTSLAAENTANYGLAVWLWFTVQLMIAGGWVVTASSRRDDPVAGDADVVDDDDLWTSAAEIAASLSWIALRHEATDRAVVFQRGAQAYQVRAKLAFGGTYTVAAGGTATQVPTLAGEEVIAGGGSDASPTFAVAPTSGTFVFQGKADTTAGTFKATTYPTAGGSAGAEGCMVALVGLTRGDPGADTLFAIASIGTLPTRATLTDEDTGVCWARVQLGEDDEAIARVKCLAVGSIPGSSASGRGGAKPIAYIRVQRDGAPSDLMGRAVDLYWYGPASSVPRVGELPVEGDDPIPFLIAGPLCWEWNGEEPL